MKTNNNFPALIEAFFTDRLMRQRQASPNTIASYRDSFCLLFNFAEQRLKKEPSALSIEDLDANKSKPKFFYDSLPPHKWMLPYQETHTVDWLFL